MSYIRTNLDKCRIVFFDLEYYVPESSRVPNAFSYNPWDKKSKFLGGSFFIANPSHDFNLSDQQVHSKIKPLWLWKHESERDLLMQIFHLLNMAEETVSKAHKNRLSPILCGIGITTSDVPVLLELFKRFKVLSNNEAFTFQNKFRYIDLSQLGISVFNNSGHFLYPKVKNDLLNKYFNGTKIESGESVWELYENENLKAIEERTRSEVFITLECYKKIYDNISKHKTLEKAEKRRIELENKFGKQDNQEFNSAPFHSARTR